MPRITIPLRLVSEANSREHWSVKAKRARVQRHAVLLALRAHKAPKPWPCVVTITRMGVRKLDDDNLARSAKSVRDSVAHYLGHDDGDPGYDWRYAQRAAGVRRYGVEITIEAKEA